MSDVKEVMLKYNETTGEIFDKNGVPIVVWFGLDYDTPQKGSTLSKLKELKAMGCSVEEIKDLNDLGLLD